MPSEKMSPKDEGKEPWENEPCKSCKRPFTAEEKFLIFAILVILLLGVCLMLVGCTVIPKTIRSGSASWDENEQNSGIIGTNAAVGGWIMTSNALARYNGLTVIYGGWFIPTNGLNDGIISGPSNRFTIDSEHVVRFGLMTSWRKGNKPPFKP